MPLVKNIEKRIFNIEGFEVNILYNGKMFAVMHLCQHNIALKE